MSVLKKTKIISTVMYEKRNRFGIFLELAGLRRKAREAGVKVATLSRLLLEKQRDSSLQVRFDCT